MTEILYYLSSATSSINPKIAIVDGMVLVQRITKTGTLDTVEDLAQGFNDRLTSLTIGFSEVILVFDTLYSPKAKTRERLRQGKAPTVYSIR